MSTHTASAPIHRISGPEELVQAVPYLLGFHPWSSLVVVGLSAGRLVVTARLDLADAACDPVVAHTLASLERAGADAVVLVLYPDPDAGSVGDVVPCAPDLPWRGLLQDVATVAERAGCAVRERLLVSGGRWWSYECSMPDCCPSEGHPLPHAPSAFAAAATVSGIVALPDRAAVEAQFDPLPVDDPVGLDELIADAEHVGVQALLSDRGGTHQRAVKRTLFAAARRADDRDWTPPDPAEAARLAVGLSVITIRDAVWIALDARRLDGQALWHHLGRTVPAPYCAAPLFLAGWQAWRRGEGALARVAAERALDADPGYSAADLLIAALTTGVDPRRFPRLRNERRR